MLGAWFGAMIGDWIMRRGRRLALRATSLPLAGAWVLTGVAPCVELVYVTSFIGGLCCSVITMVAQVKEKKEKNKVNRPDRSSRNCPTDVCIVRRASFMTGVHIGNLDARHPRLFVGDVEGAGSRRCPAVVHSRYISELAAKRATGRHRAVDALFGNSLYTGDTVVPRPERERRRGRE